MKKKDIVKRLRSEFNQIIVPDVLDEVRSRSNIKRKSALKRGFKKFVPVLAMTLILIAVIVPMQVYFFNFDAEAAAMISMDFNPSIELTVNKGGNVIKAEGINSEGKKILDNLKFKRKAIDIVVTVILEEAERQGYDVSEILYSLETNNPELKTNIRNRINENTENYYKKKNKNGNISWNDTAINQDIRKQAEKLGISGAKLQLVLQIIDKHPEYTVEQLAHKSMKELRRISGGN